MRRLTAFLLAIACLAAGEDFEKAHAAFKAYLKRPSLWKRTIGRVRLAASGDLRALEILAASYPRAEEPKEQVQSLIVSIASDYLAEPETVPLYDAWRERNDRPEDAYLWYRALIPHLEAKGPGELAAIAMSDRNAFLRAAAIEAMRTVNRQELLQLIPEIAGKLPPEGMARAVMLESLGNCLPLFRKIRAKPEFRPAAEAVIRRMGEPATLPRTQVVLARCLARALEVKYRFRIAGKWMEELEFLQRGGKQASTEGYAQPPTFAGIEATGDRIAYVIDMSDSMLEPLTVPEIEKLPKGPVSGVNESRRKEKESESELWKKAFEAVRWDRVKTRFDAAREMLKVSLLSLDEKKSFAVIGFGDAAAPLKTTPGLLRATAVNVQKVFRELDGMRPGPKRGDRPHGTLRGATNLHGGIHRAFQLRGGGMVGAGSYVNLATFDEGCDTIFVLSDGDPTWDDWPANDARDPEDSVGDPESGSHRESDEKTLHFSGPFARAFHLAEDVERLNLFRKAEIHCVAMGEATMGLLERIAGLGHGQALSLTAAKKK